MRFQKSTKQIFYGFRLRLKRLSKYFKQAPNQQYELGTKRIFMPNSFLIGEDIMHLLSSIICAGLKFVIILSPLFLSNNFVDPKILSCQLALLSSPIILFPVSIISSLLDSLPDSCSFFLFILLLLLLFILLFFLLRLFLEFLLFFFCKILLTFPKVSWIFFLL